MNINKFQGRLAGTVVACLLPVSAALACPLLNDGPTLFSSNTSSLSDDFRVSVAGTLTVSIADLPSQDSISNFNFSLWSKPGGPTPDFWSGASLIGQLFGAGDISIPVLPGFVYAFTFGSNNGATVSGPFGVDVTFEPNNPAPVPLPGSSVLLLSALGLLAGWRTNRTSSPA
jgi:hypothetical protein